MNHWSTWTLEQIEAHNAAGPNWWMPNGKRPRIPENWRADYAEEPQP